MARCLALHLWGVEADASPIEPIRATTVQSIIENPDAYLATAARMLEAEGLNDAAEILRVSSVRIEQTGFDNWNGGTDIWTIYLQLEPKAYTLLGVRREPLEEQINQHLAPVLDPITSDWFGVKITPKVLPNPEWRHSSNDVSRPTRQNIIDGLILNNVAWSGRLEEVEFLERLYDLKSLPSFDSRFPHAARDIWQHRYNNPEDWPDNWVYSDARFNLLNCPTSEFLRFLCEMVHPVVRPDRNEALSLVNQFNDQLSSDGWGLVEQEKIAGRPRFVARQNRSGSARSVSRARSVAEALDAGWMQKEIERLEKSVDLDPALAIGTAKELVETCCKSILSKRGIEFTRKTDLPELTKLLAKDLQLVPEGISDQAKGAETIRLILRNLMAITHYLAELRGLYGSGHGREGQYRGLEPRHARLAVGAAAAFIDFVTETHQRRSTQPQVGVSKLPRDG